MSDEQLTELVDDAIERLAYEEDGEPDGCYYCGSPHHLTSDCHAPYASSVVYAAGYAYACGYHD
jgi:hypothetical protein